MHNNTPADPALVFIVVVVLGPAVIGIIGFAWWVVSELVMRNRILRLRLERMKFLRMRRVGRNARRATRDVGAA
jgi:hypothetical protein